VRDSVAVIKFTSVIQEYMKDDYTDEQQSDCISLLRFLHNKKDRLITVDRSL
jgi:hypothetical protein